jgi:phosphate-selective porin
VRKTTIYLLLGLLFAIVAPGLAFAQGEVKSPEGTPPAVTAPVVTPPPVAAPVVTPPPVAAPEEKKPNDFNVSWKEGIAFESVDKRFSLKFGGRFMTDVLFASGSDELEADVGEFEDGIEVRRARFDLSGTIYNNIKFRTEYDWAGGQSKVKDAYIELSKVFGENSIRIGHFKEPFVMDEITSSKYTTFLEPATVNTFAPGENMGIMLLPVVYQRE